GPSWMAAGHNAAVDPVRTGDAGATAVGTCEHSTDCRQIVTKYLPNDRRPILTVRRAMWSLTRVPTNWLAISVIALGARYRYSPCLGSFSHRHRAGTRWIRSDAHAP